MITSTTSWEKYANLPFVAKAMFSFCVNGTITRDMRSILMLIACRSKTSQWSRWIFRAKFYKGFSCELEMAEISFHTTLSMQVVRENIDVLVAAGYVIRNGTTYRLDLDRICACAPLPPSSHNTSSYQAQ